MEISFIKINDSVVMTMEIPMALGIYSISTDAINRLLSPLLFSVF